MQTSEVADRPPAPLPRESLLSNAKNHTTTDHCASLRQREGIRGDGVGGLSPVGPFIQGRWRETAWDPALPSCHRTERSLTLQGPARPAPSRRAQGPPPRHRQRCARATWGRARVRGAVRGAARSCVSRRRTSPWMGFSSAGQTPPAGSSSRNVSGPGRTSRSLFSVGTCASATATSGPLRAPVATERRCYLELTHPRAQRLPAQEFCP